MRHLSNTSFAGRKTDDFNALSQVTHDNEKVRADLPCFELTCITLFSNYHSGITQSRPIISKAGGGEYL